MGVPEPLGEAINVSETTCEAVSLHERDQNTHFFHRHASTRRKNNFIQRIKDENGEWRQTGGEIQGVITKFFEQLFKSLGVDGKLSSRETVNQITDDENEALISDVTAEEVKEAVFSMHPGPDGLNLGFFQSF